MCLRYFAGQVWDYAGISSSERPERRKNRGMLNNGNVFVLLRLEFWPRPNVDLPWWVEFGVQFWCRCAGSSFFFIQGWSKEENVYLTNKEALAVYCTVMKHDGHLEHEGNVENTSRRPVFSPFLKCSQMSTWVTSPSAVKRTKAEVWVHIQSIVILFPFYLHHKSWDTMP